jgi:ATP-dependent RNA helicase DDX3X
LQIITDYIDRFTVIDEADEMLSDGWEEIMDKLFQGSGLF